MIGKCAEGGSPKANKRGSRFCDYTRRKAYSRKIERITTGGRKIADMNSLESKSCRRESVKDRENPQRLRWRKYSGWLGETDGRRMVRPYFLPVR